MASQRDYLAHILIGIGVCVLSGVATYAAPSRVQQDIFASDCTATTTHTGMGVTTAYGCPEPPTVETSAQVVSRSPMVFEGWFDVLNKQSLKITLSDGREYVLGVDPQLSAVGDRWELRLTGASILPLGVHTMTITMVATNGSVVAVSKQFHIVGELSPAVPSEPGDTGVAGGVHAGGSSDTGASGASGGGARNAAGSGTSQPISFGVAATTTDDDKRVVTDASTPLIEQIRRAVVSYTSPSLLLAFFTSALFFGYVFYLMGRHYRYIEEQHKNQLKALKRAARKNKPAKPKVALHHAAGTRKKRHA